MGPPAKSPGTGPPTSDTFPTVMDVALTPTEVAPPLPPAGAGARVVLVPPPAELVPPPLVPPPPLLEPPPAETAPPADPPPPPELEAPPELPPGVLEGFWPCAAPMADELCPPAPEEPGPAD